MNVYDLLVDETQIVEATMDIPFEGNFSRIKHIGDILIGISFEEPPDFVEIDSNAGLVKRFDYSANYYPLNLNLSSVNICVKYITVSPNSNKSGTFHYGFLSRDSALSDAGYNPYLDSVYVFGMLKGPIGRLRVNPNNPTPINSLLLIRRFHSDSDVLFIQP